jgi:hypothetical protein
MKSEYLPPELHGPEKKEPRKPEGQVSHFCELFVRPIQARKIRHVMSKLNISRQEAIRRMIDSYTIEGGE